MNTTASDVAFISAKPIVPWMGGKRRLAKHLLPLFPKHTCYVELFCGGAALFFLKDGQANCEVLNDINGELVNLYRVVQHHLDEFVRQFRWSLSSREMFKWAQLSQSETLTDIQRAARFYYLQRHAFGGKITGQSYGTATQGNQLNFLRIEEELTAAHLRLNGVNVERLPWDKCLDRYDREYTFFYADPPYFDTNGYGTDFGPEHYQLLAHKMRSCQGKVMLSINDHPYIRETFAGLRMVELSLKYSVSRDIKAKKRDSRELAIMNYGV